MRTTLAASLALALVLAASCGSTPDAPTAASGGRCAVSVKLSDAPVSMGGGSVSAVLTADPTCFWSEVSEVSWISGFTPTSGRGNSDVRFQVAGNPGPARTGEILFNDQSVQLRQDGIDCVFDMQPTSQTIGPDITTGSVNVTTATGCTWTAI